MKKSLFMTSVRLVLAILVLSSMLPTVVFAEEAPKTDSPLPIVLDEVLPDAEPLAAPNPEPEGTAPFVASSDDNNANPIKSMTEESPAEEMEFNGVTQWTPTIVVDHTGLTFSHPEFMHQPSGTIPESYSLEIKVNNIVVLKPEKGNYTPNQEYSLKFETEGVNKCVVTLWAHYPDGKPFPKHQIGQNKPTSPEVPEVTPPVTPPTPSTPTYTSDDDDDDDDVGIDYTAMDTTTIEDAAVPLASAPLLTILDEEVPLGNLPKTGGSSTALVRLGMSAVLLGALVCLCPTKK